MHPLLARQLRRVFGASDRTPVPPALLALIDEAYRQADEDRALLRRSIDIAGAELEERYEEARRAAAVS
jgi:hypothetical protein